MSIKKHLTYLIICIAICLWVIIPIGKNEISHASWSICAWVAWLPISECNTLVDIVRANSGTINFWALPHWRQATGGSITTICGSWEWVSCSNGHINSLILDNDGIQNIPSTINNLTRLTYLSLQGDNISDLPAELRQLTWLTDLVLIHNNLTSLSPEIGNLTNLVDLSVTNNSITSLPTEIGNLSHLVDLYVDVNSITSLPTEIGNLSNLVHLYINDNSLTSLPTEIGNLSHLLALNANYNSISLLPSSITNLVQLHELYLNGNGLSSLPADLGNISGLQVLYAAQNAFTTLPIGIMNMTNLGSLRVQRNNIVTLPYGFFNNLTNLWTVVLDDNCLSVQSLGTDDITYLDTNDWSWRFSQQVCNDSTLSWIAISPLSGVQTNDLPFVFTTTYTQSTWGVMTGSVDLDLWTGMIEDSSNTWWVSIGSGIYRYTISPVDTVESSGTIIFSGAFGSEAQTGIIYSFTFTIQTWYDLDLSNNSVTGEYSWIDAPYVAPVIIPVAPPSGGGGVTRNINRISLVLSNPLPKNTLPSSLTSTLNGYTTETPYGSTSSCIIENTGMYDASTTQAYLFACNHKITTKPSIDMSLFSGTVSRRDIAKMMTNFATEILGKKIDETKTCLFTDIKNEDSEAQGYITKVCQLGIMWYQGDGKTQQQLFQPNEILTRAQFGTIISRLLRGNTNNTTATDTAQWYTHHLDALLKAGFISNIDPDLIEERIYIWTILQRIGQNHA